MTKEVIRLGRLRYVYHSVEESVKIARTGAADGPAVDALVNVFLFGILAW